MQQIQRLQIIIKRESIIKMFKKNPNRPPITINLRKVNTGYKVVSNDAFNPFSFKRVTRAIFRHDLYNQNSKGPQTSISGIAPNATILQPPSHATIPLSAKWFNLDEIHDIEREAFPQFFLQEDQEGKLFRKTPKLYRFYRNFIINLWRDNSKKYLSPSLCRRNLPGDVSSIIRIHAFLQHWGLINFPSKQHTKDYVQSKSYQYCCHVCQQTNAGQYYVCRIDEETLFHVCDCCYAAQIYPVALKQLPFRKIIRQTHDQLRKRRMSQQQICKMLEILNSEGNRQKDAWAILAKTFPHYTKQQILLNFLEIPANHKMNANIFDSNEDFIPDKEPPMTEQPTIFQDYQNQQQLSIALTYYLWKTQPEKYPELQNLFDAATKHAADMAQVQNQKCVQMLRMLIDVQQSKLQLKTIFLQQLEKLTNAQITHLQKVSINLIAEQLKNHEMQAQ